MLRTKAGMEVINAVPVDRVLLETDAPFAFKVQHVNEIEKKLKETLLEISDIVSKNSNKVFCY